MKKGILCIMLLAMATLSLTSCSTAKMEAKNAVLSATVPVVAKYGDCKNSEAIKIHFDEKLSEWLKLNEAQAEGEGKIALKMVCEVAVAAVVPSIISIGGGKLPESWECSLTTINSTALELAKEVCGKIK